MYSKFLKKNKALLKESRSFRNSRSLARRKRKVFESYYDGYSESTLKAAWQDFKDSYDYPNLADAVLNALGDNIHDQLSVLFDMYRGNGFYLSSKEYDEFFVENEYDILAIAENRGTEFYKEIGDTLVRNGLYSMCEFLCDVAASNVTHAFFDNIDIEDYADEEYDELEDDED